MPVSFSRCDKSMLGIRALDASVVFNPLVVLDKFGRDAVSQVGRNMIESTQLRCRIHTNTLRSATVKRLSAKY